MFLCIHKFRLHELFKVQQSLKKVGVRTFCLGYKKLNNNVEKLKSFEDFDKDLVSLLENVNSKFLPRKSTSLAYFIDSSKSLQTLLNFGVELYKIERKNPETINYLAKLDFFTELRPKFIFLNDLGVNPNEFGEVLTKNPEILNPTYSTMKLKEVVEYFNSMGFTEEQILSMIVRCPKLFTSNIVEIDQVLGFLQKFQVSTKKLNLLPDEVRSLVIRCPNLMLKSTMSLYLNGQVIERTFGFNHCQIKSILIDNPKLLITDTKDLEMKYLFMNRILGLDADEIINNNKIFENKIKTCEHRHDFLKSKGMAQYNSKLANYIFPTKYFCCTDEQFVKYVKCDIVDYENFLKTL